jgi:hypothetical protein
MGGSRKMSYRQNYSATVHYSGSVSVSYPASEKGGSTTAHYSGEVPVHVAINVNTTPFDGSVANCNGSIDVLTGSVVAMNTAQCVAIKDTAAKVSKSIIDGFFGTIKTELSQQLQALDSAIKANFGLIEQQAKAVTAQKGVMETDYNRISSRYAALFSDLDTECYKRIYALDKQSFLLSGKVQGELLSEKTRNNAALNLLEITEESLSKMLLVVSNLNRKTRDVLRTMHEYITQESTIALLINSFLMNEQMQASETVYSPAIYFESDKLDDLSQSTNAYISDYISNTQKSEISQKITADCIANDTVSWGPILSGEREIVNKEFIDMTEQYFESKGEDTDKRVYAAMLSLWQNSKLQSAEKRDTAASYRR